MLARIIQARTQHLTRHNLFDEQENVPEDADTPCEASADTPVGPVLPVSERFPLFRLFGHDAGPGTFLRLEEHRPQFNRGDANAFNWGKDVWHALQAYWSQVTIHLDGSACPSFEPTPWVVAACDAAISCGATVFARADGDVSISSLTRTFKGATRRFAYLCGCRLFQEDGVDSKRLRPLWVPQVEAMQVHVCLLNPLSVNVVLEQWGLHCLELEVQAGDQPVRWSAKAAWIPDLSEFVAAPRRRSMTKSAPVVVSCFSHPAVGAREPLPEPIEECPEGEVTFGSKQAAMQMKRRLAKLTSHNERARNRALHVIAVERLLERPRCVLCGVARRKGHWLRLAQCDCSAPPVSDERTAAVQAEADRAQHLLQELESVIRTKSSRPDLKRALEVQKRQREASEPLVPFLEVLHMPRRRQNAMLVRHGYRTAEQRTARAEIRRLNP